jgi:hypothetical protein
MDRVLAPSRRLARPETTVASLMQGGEPIAFGPLHRPKKEACPPHCAAISLTYGQSKKIDTFSPKKPISHPINQ